MNGRDGIFKEIVRERNRQEWLCDQGKFRHTLSDTTEIGPGPTRVDALSPCQKHAVVAEELGEVARACLALEGLVPSPDDEHTLRTELVQLAALTVAWLESLPDPDAEQIALAFG